MTASNLRNDRNEKFDLRERGSYERYRERNCMSDQILQKELDAIAREREQVKSFEDEVVWVGHGYGDRRFHAHAGCAALTRRDRVTKVEEHFLEEVSDKLSPCGRCYRVGAKALPRSA